MEKTFIIRPDKSKSLFEIEEIVRQNKSIILSDESKKRVIDCRNFLEEEILTKNIRVYGINTGFGSLCDKIVSQDKLEDLQLNLVRSHACGSGQQMPEEISRRMLLHKIISLSYGYSGVTLELLELLLAMYNHKVFPVIYEQGSLGASGDLAPLAHLALPLIGEGKVHYKGKVRNSIDVFKELGWETHKLVAKEGLAILNGTQFMSAIASLIVYEGFKLYKWSNYVSAVSIEAFNAKLEPFHPLVHQLRNQNGQISCAKELLLILEGSDNAKREKVHVQDPYSFRCIPQVHGASYDALDHVKNIVERELNGVNDNPNLIPEKEIILSGGNFHGQPLALAMDYAGLAISELASISERRIFQLLSGKRGLPDFLIDEPGLHSGLMIPQYLAAGIVSQNKQLASPASVDSITSSNGQEDHVSMGANAATKTLKILENSRKVIAIELINASQAFHFRKYSSSEKIQKLLKDFREKVPIITEDRYLHEDIESAIDFVNTYSLDEIN